jgi:hypothetical protein
MHKKCFFVVQDMVKNVKIYRMSIGVIFADEVVIACVITKSAN